MSPHPSIAYELAVVYDRDLVEQAAIARRAAAVRTTYSSRTVLAGLGSLLIAAGERLGGIRAASPRDLVGAAR